MPLLPCSDCGHMVSESALACPSCGRVNAVAKGTAGELLVRPAIVALMTPGAVVDIHDNSSTGEKKEFDPLKPGVLANVGILGASVVILGAAFAGLSNKDTAAPFQPMFAQIAMYMSGVIVSCTAIALIQQLLRVLWGSFGKGTNPGLRFIFGFINLALVLVPLWIGYYAAHAMTVAALTGKSMATPARSDLPWAVKLLD